MAFVSVLFVLLCLCSGVECGKWIQCYGKCLCSYDTGIVNCTGRELSAIPYPTEPKTWIRHIAFSGNSVRVIPYYGLSVYFPGLMSVDLSGNPIDECVTPPPFVKFRVISVCGTGTSASTGSPTIPATTHAPYITTDTAGSTANVMPSETSTSVDEDAEMSTTNILYFCVGAVACVGTFVACACFVVKKCAKKQNGPALERLAEPDDAIQMHVRNENIYEL